MKPKFVLAPDSFKESLASDKVCHAMKTGIERVFPNAEIVELPMADGGEGTTKALVHATNGKWVKQEVTGPLGEKVSACYGILGDGSTAIIEMAEASGLTLLAKEKRNPLLTTTFGTGELILAALKQPIDKIIIAIGGSATNDGGSGMAEALGVKFFDKNHQLLKKMNGKLLQEIDSIDPSALPSRLQQVDVLVASDVTNPLYGENGASYIFGPQKGATKQMILQLDRGLKHYAAKIQAQLNIDVSHIPGSGAAGGLGAGLLAFTNAKIENGIDLVIHFNHLKQHLQNADYCFTGEGHIDEQTRYGKTAYGVAKTAKKANVPVIALAGAISPGYEMLYKEGIQAIFSITPRALSLEEALQTAEKNIECTSENIARLLKITTK
ncbi:glycerate kinase [Listeria sp. PSOL-1]|uniref:glycerate kinase n=1 Tax=Listeria sp. PSOL-1 TaxID=1844999 RepID=UPI0013D5F6FF|nr:glycerate kinase [Listeria sp. PSOL-1]